MRHLAGALLARGVGAALEVLEQVPDADQSNTLLIIGVFRDQGRNFLVLSSDADPMVDISHESLIRQWDQLRRWVDEEARDAEIYQRLAITAARHSDAKPRFYREANLDEAVRWQRRRCPNEAWARRYHPGFGQAAAFLRVSRIKHIEEYRERKRQHQQRGRVERERLLEETAELSRQQADAAREQEQLQRQVAEASLQQARVAEKGRRERGFWPCSCSCSRRSASTSGSKPRLTRRAPGLLRLKH